MRNHCNVSVSFPAQKSTIELKIAMKTWDILKSAYLVALLHISNENTAYLFEKADISSISKQGPNTCYVALRRGGGVRLISYSSQTRSGTPVFITSVGFPQKAYRADIFSGERP